MSSLGNKPAVVIIGLIASIIAIVVFFSGKESIGEFVSDPTPIPSNPILVTVVVQPANVSTSAPQIIVITATNDKPSAAQPVAPTQRLEPQFDPNDAEGFLRWYFHEIWDSKNYEYLWTYLSDDFKDRLNLSYSSYEENWSAIGSIEEPIDINYEGKDGISLKYRVTYTTYSLKGNYPDHRKDLYWLYFNTSKDHWEFR
jgi:hypothetical protein